MIAIAGVCFAGWERTYGGVGNEMAFSIRQTPDNGFIVAGSWESDEGNVLLIKIDDTGDTVFTRSYGGESYGGASSMDQASNGDFVVFGAKEDSLGEYGSIPVKNR
jgi:hypothetical protein